MQHGTARFDRSRKSSARRNQIIEQLREQIRQLQCQEAARLLLIAEQAVGKAAATAIAIGPLTGRRVPRLPVYINELPAVPDTEAFRAFAGGGVRILIDRDARVPASPTDLEFNSREIAAQIADELEAALD